MKGKKGKLMISNFYLSNQINSDPIWVTRIKRPFSFSYQLPYKFSHRNPQTLKTAYSLPWLRIFGAVYCSISSNGLAIVSHSTYLSSLSILLHFPDRSLQFSLDQKHCLTNVAFPVFLVHFCLGGCGSRCCCSRDTEEENIQKVQFQRCRPRRSLGYVH